ncbi:MAG: nuclear transport factor 2 family protein, partial [Byssovorax sp.]
MAEKSRAAEFIDALSRLETSGELDPIVALFDPTAEIGNPLTPEPLRGQAGGREFWETYRRTLGPIQSEFRVIIESASAAALEWTS